MPPRIKKEQLVNGLTVAERNQLSNAIENIKNDITSMFKIHKPSKPYIALDGNSTIESMEKAIKEKKAYEEDVKKYEEKIKLREERLPKYIERYGEIYITLEGLLIGSDFPFEKAKKLFKFVFDNVYTEEHSNVPEEKLEKYSWYSDINDKRRDYFNERFNRVEDAFIQIINIVR